MDDIFLKNTKGVRDILKSLDKYLKQRDTKNPVCISKKDYEILYRATANNMRKKQNNFIVYRGVRLVSYGK